MSAITRIELLDPPDINLVRQNLVKGFDSVLIIKSNVITYHYFNTQKISSTIISF